MRPDSRRSMTDTPLVDVIWSGPFHADGAPIGTIIQVPKHQADLNPGWYPPANQKPVPVRPPVDSEPTA